MADLETIDVYCVTDLSPDMPEVSGRVALAHRLARRLQTERGRIPWWPNDGTDLRKFLLAKAAPSRIAAAAEQECLLDEQVEDAQADAQLSSDGKECSLTIVVTEAEGPFTFTLSITDAALTLVALQEAA